MVYRDHKVDSELLDLGLQLFSCLSSCCHPLLCFSKNILRQLSYCILHELLIIHPLINYLLLSKFIQAIQAIQAFHTCSSITSKDNILIIVLYLNISLLSSCFAFRQFRRDIFNSFFFATTLTKPCSFMFL